MAAQPLSITSTIDGHGREGAALQGRVVGSAETGGERDREDLAPVRGGRVECRGKGRARGCGGAGHLGRRDEPPVELVAVHVHAVPEGFRAEAEDKRHDDDAQLPGH